VVLGGVEVTREELGEFFETVMPYLNEVQRRVVAGAMARGLGRGGKTAVAEASGMSRDTVMKAEAEVRAGIEPSERLRPEANTSSSSPGSAAPRTVASSRRSQSRAVASPSPTIWSGGAESPCVLSSRR
jgi:hypothetical protein